MQQLVSRSLTLLGREAARIVLPSDCIACAEPLPWRQRVTSCCVRCWSKLPRITEPRCKRCATPWPTEAPVEQFHCLGCRQRDWAFEWIDSWGHYRGELESVVGAFKFKGHDFLAPALAGLMARTLEERGDVYFDLLVPIPMHRDRLRKRGYNQAELLSRELSRIIRVPTRPALRKVRANATQSQLPKALRADNVKNVFSARRPVRGERVLLVDDVCTTGETLDAAAFALLSAGASAVAAVTLCRA